MKKFYLTILCVISISIIIFESHIVSNGVKQGIHLCLYQVIPSLFPLILITNIIIQQGVGTLISKFFYPILHKLYGLTPNGSFAMIISFLSGFPVGAKTISHLYETSNLSLGEASHLMTFCNNCGISFIVNYVGIYCLRGCINAKMLILFIYLPPLLCGIINRFFFHNTICNDIQKGEKTNIIFDTLFALGKISIFVICFSIIVNLLTYTPLHNIENISAILEITTGISFITKSPITNSIVYCVILCCIFGGLCTMFQAFSFIKENQLKKYYIIGKIEQIIIAFILILLLN